MEMQTNRVVYLDNIRNFLVYNVVFLHAFLVFAYPIMFWWPVVDKTASSLVYETAMITMSVYMMPCLFFIAALFIFPSLQKEGTPQYLKKRFLRLYVPALVFVFCAGDIPSHLTLLRLNSLPPGYAETFISFWRSFVDLKSVNLLSSTNNILTVVWFGFSHTWFLTLLLGMTLVVGLLSLLKKEKTAPAVTGGRKSVVLPTILFAVISGFIYSVIMILLQRQNMAGSWVIIGKAVQFEVGRFPVLAGLFLFGLYVYKKNWLTERDIGSWKLWAILAALMLVPFIVMSYEFFLPVLEKLMQVLEFNMLSEDKWPPPVFPPTFEPSVLGTWFLTPPACIFLLMFFLSFARRFFNRPHAVTAFCSKHSIYVYVLHLIPLLLLQQVFLSWTIPSFVKVLLITALVIPACLWLSHRLVYPYPKIAICFFVALKGIALVAGFTFYYYALLAITFLSFAGGVGELAVYLFSRGSDAQTVPGFAARQLDEEEPS